MCGIAGVYHFDGAPVCENELVRMRDTMVHRGPDGDGLWVSDRQNLALAFRRLAIIDLSPTANQPMSNEDGSMQLVFNGEIYNHADLRQELLQFGHRFRTDHSDTEVILHAFEQWGIDCVHRFYGMFAFALWNDATQELWLARDRAGIKPLYFTVTGERLLFASEIKAILAAESVRREVNEEALFHYLSFLTSPAPATLFQGIHKLPPASWARVTRDSHVHVEQYWDVWDEVAKFEGIATSELTGALVDELRRSVRMRKVSDVPVGVFLSGGLDSSTNAVLFAEGATDPVYTFSVGYDRDYESYGNEFVYAQRVATSIKSKHFERRISLDDALEYMPFIAAHQDEPLADPVCLPLYFVSRLAREAGVIVCQVGEGSDELFCGYPHWQRSLRLQRLNAWPVPKTLKKMGMSAISAAGYENSFAHEWLRRGTLGELIFWSGAESLTEAAKHRLLSANAKRRLSGLTSFDAVHPIRQRFENRAPRDAGPLAWMSYVDLNFRLPELLLMRVDKMSMATSIECRVPFLDHRFIGLAMAIPESEKLRDGELKHSLKEALDGVLPQEIIHRKKQGFGVPVEEWLLDRMGGAIRSEIKWLANETDFFDQAGINAYVNRPLDTKAWTLYNLALWWRRYLA